MLPIQTDDVEMLVAANECVHILVLYLNIASLITLSPPLGTGDALEC